jgi:hypothetical protein
MFGRPPRATRASPTVLGILAKGGQLQSQFCGLPLLFLVKTLAGANTCFGLLLRGQEIGKFDACGASGHAEVRRLAWNGINNSLHRAPRDLP